MFLVTTWFGSFLLDGGKVAKSRLFPKDPEALADRLVRVDDWKPLEEELALVAGLDHFFVGEPRMERIGGTLTVDRPDPPKSEDWGFDRGLLHATLASLAKRRLRAAVTPDDHIAHAVRTLDSLNRQVNEAGERLREWYGLHFPELEKTTTPQEFLRLVAEHGGRDAMPHSSEGSVGATITAAESVAYRDLARLTLELGAETRRLEAYIEARMKDVAPNVAAFVGPLVGARLLAAAGGLDRLARFPASTVQLLGAEKAFFRHRKEGTRLPKHGVLYQHVWVHGAPPWQRGAVARALAGKVVLAARADRYTHRFLGDELRADAERLIANIRQRKAKRPPTPPKGLPRRAGRR